MKLYTTIFLLTLCSCSIVNKAFHKNKVSTDSTYHIVEKKDSIASIDTVRVHKDSSQSEEEIKLVFSNDSELVFRRSYSGNPAQPFAELATNGSGQIVNASDYFEITKEGTLRTNHIPQSVTIKGKIVTGNYDSLANHSKIQLSDLKEEKTEVKKQEKTVTKEVHKKSFLSMWWVLLLIIVLVCIFYRNKIKAFILTILPL